MKTSYLKPLLPLRDIVIFPSMVVPLFVGREKSIRALQEVMKSDKSIVLVTQKNSDIDDPTNKDLYQYGCLSKVLQLLKLPDGTVKVLVEGEKRIKILKHKENSNNYLTCEVEMPQEVLEECKQARTLALTCKRCFCLPMTEQLWHFKVNTQIFPKLSELAQNYNHGVYDGVLKETIFRQLEPALDLRKSILKMHL